MPLSPSSERLFADICRVSSFQRQYTFIQLYSRKRSFFLQCDSERPYTTLCADQHLPTPQDCTPKLWGKSNTSWNLRVCTPHTVYRKTCSTLFPSFLTLWSREVFFCADPMLHSLNSSLFPSTAWQFFFPLIYFYIPCTYHAVSFQPWSSFQFSDPVLGVLSDLTSMLCSRDEENPGYPYFYTI